MTEKDVKIVEFASYGAMWKGMVNNDVDAAYGTTITGPAKEVETSPRGIVWPPTPHDDKAGWARLQKVTPFINPHIATCGAGGISKDKPIQISQLPVSDLHGLRQPDRGRRLHADQGDDRRLRRLQGRRAGRDRHGGEAADQELVGAGAQGRGEGAEGSRRLERRPGEVQQRSASSGRRRSPRRGPTSTRPIRRPIRRSSPKAG